MTSAKDIAPAPSPTYPRIVSLPGRPGIEVRGLKRRRFDDVYHRLLTIHWGQFGAEAVALYLGVNVMFGFLYWLQPGGVSGAKPGSFADAFFFSVQTLGTIGYGALSPHSVYVDALVTVEAFFSIALTAVATGLTFARVSRPTARVMFSQKAVIVQRNGQPTFMLRAGNRRANQILEAEVSLSLARRGMTAEGTTFRGFYDLKTVRGRSPLFALTWSIMHVIDEDSPLFGCTQASLIEEEAEVIVVLSGVDETFAQRIHARHSYMPTEIAFAHKFVDIILTSETGDRAIDYSRFDDVEPLLAPSP